MSQLFAISPNSQTRLDYVIGWRDASPGPWLEVGETITAQTITVSVGLVLGTGLYAPQVSDGDVRFWLSPAATVYPDQRLWADVQITTSAGRIDTRRIDLIVAQR